MNLATSFLPLWQVFALEMTQPTARTFQTLLVGWLFAPRRTILGMRRAAGTVSGSGTTRHHAAFHRLFASAAWSIDAVGLRLFDCLARGRSELFLVGDDTLLSRRGLKVFGAGMHRDPLLSSRSHTVTRWGHCWVVLCVLIESRHRPGRRYALPVLCRLYLNKAAAEKWQQAYVKKTDLLLDMLLKLHEHTRPTSEPHAIHLHFLGDSAYTAPAVLARIPADIAVTGRVGANARMHAAPLSRVPGQKGRPRRRGEKLPSPAELLAQRKLPRRTLNLYDTTRYRVRLAEQTGYFYKAPARGVKIVAVEHLTGGRGREVFYTTAVQNDAGTPTNAETILNWYSWRWPIEVTFHDAKGHLGIDEPQTRVRPSALRSAATGFLLYSLIVWWHETARATPAPTLDPWQHKRGPSFAEQLAALREECLQQTRQTNFSNPTLPPSVQKYLDHLQTLIKLAA